MSAFEPRDSEFRERVTNSFNNQQFINYVGATLVRVDPGEVDIALSYKPELSQQHGYVHGGVLTAIADAAAGYAAMTLSGNGVGVLTTELKVNFLRPAGQGSLCAKARVIKPGRTLNIVQTDVVEATDGGESHVLTGLVTMMFIDGLG